MKKWKSTVMAVAVATMVAAAADAAPSASDSAAANMENCFMGTPSSRSLESCRHAQRRKISDVLMPPNAKLLLITTSVSMTRPPPVM